VPASAAVDESVRLASHLANPGAAALVNAVLRRLADPDKRPALPASQPPLLYSLPPELYGYLKKWYGPDAAESLAAAALDAEPTVSARVNPLRTTALALTAALQAQGVVAEPGHYCPQALRLTLGGQSVRQLPAWQQGLLTIQDEAAMLVAMVVDPRPGETVVDLCAAPGGKTTHLAEIMADRGRVLAFDIHPERLALVNEQAERLGLKSIQTAEADASGPGIPESLTGSADRVLADVPCSGLGLLGRKPEIRLNMTHEKMIGLYPVQQAILAFAARLVRPGGILVYSTCTINPAENSERIRTFLSTPPDAADPRDPGGTAFQLEDLTAYLPPAILQHEDLARQAREGMLQLLPDRHQTDGFFIARLRRLP
jgi:16S rRNA (cytosine967-C5)-methyltransferase